MELINEKVNSLRDLNEFVGVFVSRDYVYKKIFDMTDEEIEEQTKLMEEDKAINKKLGLDEEE